MTPFRPTLARAACALALGLCVGSMPASAQSAADFYKDKKVDLLIGYSAGGGYDVYARMIARYWGNHIPGNPQFVPRNKPGAGSLLVTNELYNIAPKDGSVIGTFARGAPLEAFFGNPAAKYDPVKLGWIGSANNEVSVCAIMNRVPIKSTEEFMAKEIVLGGTGPGADTDLFPMLMNNVLGTKFKLISGYPGGNDINLAMERGEVNGRCGWSWSSVVSTRPQWLKDGTIQITAQIALEKHPDLPNVPLVLDLAKTPRDRAILEVVFSGQPMGRPYAAPPGLQPERLKLLRDSFMATMKDPAFLAEAEKAQLEITPVDGDAIDKIMAKTSAQPKDIVMAAKDATTRTDKIQIEKK
ncbi:MAG: Bug family tripartite tricarboxylate transporter substrate binding protein [Gemmatimonas sp.]